jgi:hypothetical protein
MKKEVAYSRTVFSADVIREALRAATADQDEEQITSGLRTARRGNETWTLRTTCTSSMDFRCKRTRSVRGQAMQFAISSRSSL